MAFSLPKLPYAINALAPHLSQETLEFHYGKHHQAYVNNLNGLVQGTEWIDKTLEQIIVEAKGGLFNNAAQVWNHTFYWNCLTPGAASAPAGRLTQAIDTTFGSFAAFKEAFQKAAVGQFGSGWAWLVKQSDGKLAIEATSNADTPIAHGKTPLLTCDVWEHAYYIDYRNARPTYVDNFFKLINWDFVTSRL